MCNYVFRVPGSRNYQFRRKIPLDLVSHYERKEIKRSLGTSDRREAEKRSRILAAQLDAEWDVARATTDKVVSNGGQLESVSNSSQNMERVKYFGDEVWMREAKLVTERVRATLPPAHNKDVNALSYHLLAQLRALHTLAIDHGVVEQFLESAHRTLADREAILKTGDLDPYSLGWVASAQTSEVMRNAYQALLNGTGPTVWFNPLQLKESNNLTTQAQKVKEDGISLFSLVERWASERERNRKTLEAYNFTAKQFRDLVGKTSIRDIKREDAVRFKEELLKAGKSTANIKKQLTVVNTLLNYAVANALIESNPAAGVTIILEQREKPRISFDAEALRAIFSSPVYNKSDRPKAGAGEAAYWIPLLALFTGARLEELGQLHPSDVMEEVYYDNEDHFASAWVIRIKLLICIEN